MIRKGRITQGGTGDRGAPGRRGTGPAGGEGETVDAPTMAWKFCSPGSGPPLGHQPPPPHNSEERNSCGIRFQHAGTPDQVGTPSVGLPTPQDA